MLVIVMLDELMVLFGWLMVLLGWSMFLHDFLVFLLSCSVHRHGLEMNATYNLPMY
jgi:hypothetical protein